MAMVVAHSVAGKNGTKDPDRQREQRADEQHGEDDARKVARGFHGDDGRSAIQSRHVVDGWSLNFSRRSVQR